MKIKVSVIIPIYGVEKYIEKCARSLFCQTLDDIEYIFVNDCTLDNSMDILKRVIDEYPQRKPNVHVIQHEQNQGLPQARQTGLRYVTGEFIAHCDSDDWVDVNLYETMYQKACAENSDVVVCQFLETDGYTYFPIKMFPNACSNVITNKLLDWFQEGSLCNKLFRKTVYKDDIIPPIGAMGEDMCMVYQLSYYCNRVSLAADVFYYIRKNPTSIIRTPTEENIYRNFKQGVENYYIVESFYRKHNVINKETIRALEQLKYALRDNLRALIGRRKYYKIWCKTFPELDRQILYNSLSFRQKVRSLMIRSRVFPLPWKKEK